MQPRSVQYFVSAISASCMVSTANLKPSSGILSAILFGFHRLELPGDLAPARSGSPLVPSSAPRRRSGLRVSRAAHLLLDDGRDDFLLNLITVDDTMSADRALRLIRQ